ncbi:threonine-phosphate decarboxylase CobD [Coralliovum pocilloporae]|uniref:threonine-phosphate decarboxylase CobD n=1 Tax=Coralliovum pocilloporae TaxID=3066369 RepID=UPI00330758C2
MMQHGGDLAAASLTYGTPEQGWLDLSTGISPHSYPFSSDCLSEALIRELPDSGPYQRLAETAARTYQAKTSSQLALASGSQGVIQTLPSILPGKNIIILSPTYNEHAKAWGKAGWTVKPEPDLEPEPDSDVILIVNPNNPTGRLFNQTDLLSLADKLTEKGRWLIIDEAFGDLVPDQSLVPHVAGRNLIVLKSIGKFYGLAGLRVGFAVADESIVEQLKDRIGPWPITGPSLVLAEQALSDHGWQAEQSTRLRILRERLDTILDRHGLSPIGGTDLFQLIETDGAKTLHDHLARRGIWTRIFDYAPTWMRIGLPDERQNGFDRFEQALSEWSSTHAS